MQNSTPEPYAGIPLPVLPGPEQASTTNTSLELADYVKRARSLPTPPDAAAPSPSVEKQAYGVGEGAALAQRPQSSAGDEYAPEPGGAADANPSPSAPEAPPVDVVAQVAAGRLRAFRCLGLFAVANALGIGLTALTDIVLFVVVGVLVGFCFGLAGFWYGAAAFWRGLATYPKAPARDVILALGGSIASLAAALLGAFLALLSTMAFTRGRQIRRFGRVLLPPVGAGDAWSRATPGVPTGPLALEGADVESRRALAAQWCENGRTEHASVAAFARHTLDLIALGAPPSLVAAAQRDALDEIRHAELCFALARSIDGGDRSPGAFPQAARSVTLPKPRLMALSELAVDSLVDGALHEGASARIVAKLARRCEDPAIASILKEIAADEGRHSAHGWDVVRWCVAEGGEPVLRSLEAAARALPQTVHSELPEAARQGAWERWGIAGEALEADELSRARADLVRRVEALAAGVSRRAA
jgi:hypothetical protein